MPTHIIKETKTLLLIAITAIFPALSLMPPSVYVQKIKKSKIKAIAKIIDVKVTQKTEYRITQEVTFELITSYGEVKPHKQFKGWCYTSGEKPMVGGDLYYYPKAGEKVFVTIMQAEDNDEAGMITSYTIASKKLIVELKEKGLSALEYSIGKVKLK